MGQSMPVLRKTLAKYDVVQDKTPSENIDTLPSSYVNEILAHASYDSADDVDCQDFSDGGVE